MKLSPPVRQALRNLYIFLIFLAWLPSSLAAYLDPGTGSMLFSALVGLVSTLYFTLGSTAVTLRVKLAGFFKRDLANQHSIVFFSEGKQYWNCFWPILQELEARQVEATYWTMDPEDPALGSVGQNLQYIESRFIGTGYTAFAQMNALQTEICVMTTPGLDVLQIRRSKKVKHYSHLIHALDDCTTYRVFGTDYFDSMLLSGQHQVEALEGLEAVRNIPRKQKYIVGCTYLDVLQQKWEGLRQQEHSQENGLKRGKQNSCLLIAPSWGPNSLLAKYGMDLLRPLLELGYQLLIRPHPQSRISEAELLQDLLQQTSPYSSQLQWDFECDSTHAFRASAAMISDFSSIIYDYLILLEKPVFIAEFEFNYDGYDAMDLLPREPWALRAGHEVGILFEDIGQLADLLQQNLQGAQTTEFRSKLAKLRHYAYQYPGEAGRRGANCILQIRDSLRASTL